MEIVLPSSQGPGDGNLIRLRRVVSDAAVTSGHAHGIETVTQKGREDSAHVQGIELTSFQWGVGRGITSSPAGTATAITSDAHWIDLTSFQWGVGRGIAEANLMSGHGAMPAESLSLNF
jgi:hypothetical protein